MSMLQIFRFQSLAQTGGKAAAPKAPVAREPAIPRPPIISKAVVSIKIFPPFAEFIEFGGASRHVLTNNGTCRTVFKVKCSNNGVFKVSPVYAFLDIGASVELQILRKEGPAKHDKLVIKLKEAKRSDKDPRISFDSDYIVHKHIIPLLTRVVEEEEH